MESLNGLFTEDQALKVSEKVLKSVCNKMHTDIVEAFYKEMEGYLYEVYDNSKSKIFENLVNEITDSFINDPGNYKFSKLRQRIFEEHKEEILPTLTDEIIMDNVQKSLNVNTSNQYLFNWQWKDAIVKLVLSNWETFHNDERIKIGFGREIESLKYKISSLQLRINELESFEDNS